MTRSALLFLSVALLAFAPARGASAYEDAIELALGAGYAARAGGDGEGFGRHGMGFAGTIGFGLDDAWSLRVSGMNHLFLPEPRFRRSALLFEATYALDIVRVVPVLGVGLGGGLEGAPGRREIAPAFSAFVSFDVLVSRELIVGPELRLIALPFAGIEGAGDISLAASFRVAYLWDRF